MSFMNKLKRFFVSLAGRIVMIALLYVIILSICMGIVEATDSTLILGIVFVILGYFGWQTLSMITPNIFLIMPIGGWLIYYLIKGLLSIFIGAFVAPFVIARKIVAIISKGLQESEKEATVQVNIAPNITVNPTVQKTSVYEINMSKIKNLPVEKLEEMHKTLLKYLQRMPAPTENSNYLSELKNFEASPIENGGIYGCKTYGEARIMNREIVKRLDELDPN